jgi:hypothetical protein
MRSHGVVPILCPKGMKLSSGPLNAFQRGVFVDKVTALAILICAFLLIAVIALGFGERRSVGNDVPPSLYFALASFDLALTLLLYLSLAAPRLR